MNSELIVAFDILDKLVTEAGLEFHEVCALEYAIKVLKTHVSSLDKDRYQELLAEYDAVVEHNLQLFDALEGEDK